MTTSTWISGTSGVWTNVANWSSGSVPGNGDTAVIDAPGNYLISVPGQVHVNNLILNDAGAAVDIGGNIVVDTDLDIDAGLFDNSGMTLAANLNNAGTFDNSGAATIDGLINSGFVGNSGTLTINPGSFSNTGSINDTGTVTLNGSFTSAQLGNVGGSGQVNINGSVDNTGATLGGTGPTYIISGFVQGGTLEGENQFRPNEGLQSSTRVGNGATIDGVTVAGLLTTFGTTTVLDGLSAPTGGGGGTMTVGDTLYFANVETVSGVVLTGNGTIDAGSILTMDGTLLAIGSNIGANTTDNNANVVFDGAGTVVYNGSIQATSTDDTENGISHSGYSLITIQNADFENFGALSVTDFSALLSGGGVGEGVQLATSAVLAITAGTFVNHAGGVIETGEDFGTGFVTISAATNFTNDGTLSTKNPDAIQGGSIEIDAFVQGDGTIDIDGGGAVTLGGATSNTQVIDFLNGGDILRLLRPSFVPAIIEGFNAGDSIILAGVTATPISFTDGDLKLQTASGTLDLAITGDYFLNDFLVNTNGTDTVIQRTLTENFTWVAGTSGVWTTAANWSPDVVPDAGDVAMIGVPGTYTVAAPGTITVFGLTIDNAAADVGISGNFTVLNILFNTGTIDNTGTLSTVGFGNLGVINNTGTLVLTGIGSGDNSTLLNNAGGTLLNTGSSFLQNGSIQGGTLVNADVGSFFTLDGVTVLGSLTTAGNVTVLDELTAVATPTLYFSAGSLEFAGDQSLAGITLVGGGSIVADNILTIDNDVTISEAVGAVAAVQGQEFEPLVFGSAGTIINHGSISANSIDSIERTETFPPFGHTSLDGNASLSIAADFENFGVIDASDRSDVRVVEISQSLTPSDGTLDINAPTFVNEAGGIIETGQNFGTAEILIAGTTDFINDGTVTTESHDPSLFEPGAGSATGATIDIAAAVTGSGTIVVENGTVTVESAVASTQTIAFSGSEGTLVVDDPASMQAVIVGFNPVGGIILNGVSATAISYTSGDLKLQTSIGTLDLGITGEHSLSDFSIVAASDETAIDATLPCLAAGTRVATDRGTVLVEQLRVGDSVVTGDGQLQAIQWIGHRDTDCEHHPNPRAVWPARVAAHAFGHGLPGRALLLSPDHAVFVDNVLVPVKCLINGTTIVQRKVARVTYYHVELPRHDVLLADGLPVESYLETGGRSAFENGGEVMQLHPNFAPDPVRAALIWDSEGYAPLVVAPGQLAPIRERLRRQAEALEVARCGRRRASKAA